MFSLNATVPVFLMMVFGWFVHRIKLLDDNATSQINKFVFRTLLPALLFMDLSTADFRRVWDGKFVLFCMGATLLSVGVAVVYSLIVGKGCERGEIIQASYRSSAAVLGIAFVNNIYGHSTMAALMIVGTVPLYNVIAVTALAVTSQSPLPILETWRLPCLLSPLELPSNSARQRESFLLRWVSPL